MNLSIYIRYRERERGKNQGRNERREDKRRHCWDQKDGRFYYFIAASGTSYSDQPRDNEARDGHINNANLSSVTRYLSLAWQPPRHDGVPTSDRTRSGHGTILRILMLGSGIPDKMAAIFVFATHTSCLVSLSSFSFLPSFLPFEGICINSIDSISSSILSDERERNYCFARFFLLLLLLLLFQGRFYRVTICWNG